MNKRLSLLLKVALVIIVFSSMSRQAVYAQNEKEEPLNQEWVKNDVDGIAALMKFTPVENQNIEVLKKRQKDDWSVDDDALGFGANRVRFSKGYGYSSMYVDVLTFNNQVAYYEIGVIGSFSKWSQYRQQVIDAWKQNGGPEFSENGYHLTYQRNFETVFDSYYRAVGNELGVMKFVSVPADLKDAYDYLTSPLNNSYVGEGICGLGGPVLVGKTSIDALINANRIDLIENVLRGYNPGGRIFAAIALLRMKRDGLQLDSEVMASLKKVVKLEVPASTCAGCIVMSGRKAKDIVAEFMER